MSSEAEGGNNSRQADVMARVAERLDDAQRALGLQHIALTDEDIPAAKEQGTAALEAIHRGIRLLHTAGAQPRQERRTESARISAGSSAAAGDGLDLGKLAMLDSSTVRELLAVLRERVMPLAERLDAERGRALPLDVPLQKDESRGTDLAETLSEIVLRLRIEVEGPVGRD